MSLSLALNNALSGLNINQRQLSVLSHNIANANTAGYSRQVLNQSAIYVGAVGQGVQVNSVSRQIDEYLRRSVQDQNANVGTASTVSEYQSRLQVLLGSPGSANGVDSYVTNFFNSLRSLSQSPELVSVQQSTVSSGIALASQVSSLARESHNLRFEADTDIGNAVKYVNQQIKDLYQVNQSLNSASVLGADTGGLLDQRDALIKNISHYVDVNATFKQSGEVQLSTGNGVALLDQSAYQLNYSAAPSVDSLINNVPLSPLTVSRLDPAGNPIGNPVTLVSGGTSDTIASSLKGGSLKALVDMRDKTLPGVIGQLDTMAATVRDQLNAIHNKGTGYPPANQLTGTRPISAQSVSDWSGSIRVAVLNAQGKPIASPYAGESGFAPLNIDLSSLNSGSTNGRVPLQTIINELNQGFTPQSKAMVGNLNNIRLTSNIPALPSTPAAINFDFDLENLSANGSSFFVNGVTIKDSTGATMAAPVTSTIPSIALAASNTFTTHAAPDANTVTVATAGAHNLVEGQRVYLSNPGAVPDVNGIPNTSLQGYFIVHNVTASGFDITVADPATSASGVSVSGQKALPPYQQVAAGETTRTRGNGTISADLTANATSPYYDISAQVAVDDGHGGFTTTTVTYRVQNFQQNTLNQRYGAVAVGVGGTLVQPSSRQPVAVAKMVDANGKELPKVNGQYVGETGYLKIEGANGNTIAIDELNSKQAGSLQSNPPDEGTGRGFSHYFELNNLFKSNLPSASGDTLKGSALNLKLEDRIANAPNLLSLGSLVRSPQSADPAAAPVYTYERSSGDNQAVKAMADIAGQTFAFAASGGLPASTQTLGGFAGQFLGFNAAQAAGAEGNLKSTQLLLDGFQARASAVSGVNLDEELANTIVYQNAYSASARIISVTSSLYDALLNTFN